MSTLKYYCLVSGESIYQAGRAVVLFSTRTTAKKFCKALRITGAEIKGPISIEALQRIGMVDFTIDPEPPGPSGGLVIVYR